VRVGRWRRVPGPTRRRVPRVIQKLSEKTGRKSHPVNPSGPTHYTGRRYAAQVLMIDALSAGVMPLCRIVDWSNESE
jgi:hypothetical protein